MATKIGGATIRPLFGFVEVLAAIAIECPLIKWIIYNERIDVRGCGITVGTAGRDVSTIISIFPARLRFDFVLNVML
jgi:hypothetical protein